MFTATQITSAAVELNSILRTTAPPTYETVTHIFSRRFITAAAAAAAAAVLFFCLNDFQKARRKPSHFSLLTCVMYMCNSNHHQRLHKYYYYSSRGAGHARACVCLPYTPHVIVGVYFRYVPTRARERGRRRLACVVEVFQNHCRHASALASAVAILTGARLIILLLMKVKIWLSE